MMMLAVKLFLVHTALIAAAVSLPPYQVGTWTGQLETGTFTGISSTFQVPQAHCGTNESQAAFWAGIGEWNGIAQTGIAVDCSQSHASYSGWFQMYPSSSHGLGGTVKAGDWVHVGVRSLGGDRWTLQLGDYTQHWSRNTEAYGRVALSTAEVIREASDGPLAQTSPVRFYDIRVVNG